MIRINTDRLSSLESQMISNIAETKVNKIKFNTFVFDADIIEDMKGNIYVRYLPVKNMREGDAE